MRQVLPGPDGHDLALALGVDPVKHNIDLDRVSAQGLHMSRMLWTPDVIKVGFALPAVIERALA